MLSPATARVITLIPSSNISVSPGDSVTKLGAITIAPPTKEYDGARTPSCSSKTMTMSRPQLDATAKRRGPACAVREFKTVWVKIATPGSTSGPKILPMQK